MKLLIICVVIIVGVAVIDAIRTKRQQKLKQIVQDLERLLQSKPDETYAIQENIAFFKAIRTLPGYVIWALTRRRRIVASKLLEIADLNLPRWEKELYADLAHVERKNIPGLSKPLRNLLLEYVATEPVKLLDLGCGSMEVERQLITELRKQGTVQPSLFVGVDLAPQAWDAIQETFAELQDVVVLKQIKNLSEVVDYKPQKPTILFFCGDALEAARLHGHLFKVVFSSRFRHHLNDSQKQLLDKLRVSIADYSIEYDDYRSAFSWILPLTTAWNRPILLNGAIFSQIRQPWKKDLKGHYGKFERTTIKLFSPPGSYARISTKK